MRRNALTILIAAVAACASAQNARSGFSVGASKDATSPIREARQRWNAAIASHDTTPLRALLADSIVQVSPYFVRPGKDGYIAGFARQFSSRPQFFMAYEPTTVDVRIVGFDTLATEQGSWRETWLEQGTDPTEMHGDYFAIWHRQGPDWVIVREVFAPRSCSGKRYCKR
ncbi:MAG: YybH family protein [Gemmatimonadaceae bacterium]